MTEADVNAGVSADAVLALDTAVPYLRRRGLLDATTRASATSLAGGVSGEVLAVDADGTHLVVKQALPQLRVQAEWKADPNRILTEAAALRLAATITPDAVPPVIDVDADNHVMVMGHAPLTLRPWKQDLLDGQVAVPVAHRLGELLSAWHSGTAHDERVARSFGDLSAFVDLRVEPFYTATARVHADLAATIGGLGERLLSNPVCLVHGDFSPKNVLTDGQTVWVLDWEVAHYGDPVFDLAFLLSHLMCKAIHRRDVDYRPAAAAFLAAYRSARSTSVPAPGTDLVAHTAALVLARVDGTSPVGYLTPPQGDRARTLARTALAAPPSDPLDLWELL
jgi:tRNA A-37 threonylcarbamoyl transferase component Bud32